MNTTLSNDEFNDAFIALAQQNPMLAYGPAYMGIPIDTFLLGWQTAILIHWISRGDERDTWWRRALMIYVYVCSVATTGLVLYFGLDVFVIKRDDPLPFLYQPVVRWVLTPETVFVIQAFFAWRAYSLWGRKLWMGLILLFLFTTLNALSIANIILSGNNLLRFSQGILLLPFITLLACHETFVTILIISGLMRFKTDTFTGDRLVTRLVKMAVQAQLFPTLVSIGIILKCVINGKSIESACIFLISPGVSKVWHITLMLVLDSKHDLKRDMETDRLRRQSELADVDHNAVAQHRSQILTELRPSQSFGPAPNLSFQTKSGGLIFQTDTYRSKSDIESNIGLNILYEDGEEDTYFSPTQLLHSRITPSPLPLPSSSSRGGEMSFLDMLADDRGR